MAKLCTFELENGADVHAETDYWGGGRPQPIYEFCAQRLQEFETEHERGNAHHLNRFMSFVRCVCKNLKRNTNTDYSLPVSDLEKMRIINKLVMDKKKKRNI